MRRPQIELLRLAALTATSLLLADRAAADPTDDLAPVLAGVRAAVADGRVTPGKMLGFDNPKGDFTESPSEPGVLVGFDLGLGKFFDIEVIYAYRAVFKTAHGDETLSDHGLFRDKSGPKNKHWKTKVLHTVHVRARPGYAVGALTLRSGLDVNGLSVTFMRIKDGKLDPQQSYESEWVGDRTGGGEATIGGDGSPAIGISGCQDEEHASALGLTFTTDPAPAGVPPAEFAPLARPPAAPMLQPPPVPAPFAAPARANDPAPRQDAPRQAEPPQPPPADAAQEPAAPPAPTNTPAAAEKSPIDLLLAYGIPGAAFVAITGLILVFTLTSLNRNRQSARPAPNRAARPAARPVIAVTASTALQEKPTTRRAADDVMELTEADFDPEVPPPAASTTPPKKAPAGADSWPKLEL